MGGHVFIDNSNILGGAQGTAAVREPGTPWVAVRVYYRHLFRLVEGSHDVNTRVMAGSVPPGSDELWDYSRRGGYDTGLLKKIGTDDGRLASKVWMNCCT